DGIRGYKVTGVQTCALPILVRSYATEAVVTRAKGAQVNESAAQSFLENLHGRHETVDSEPGLYRHTEVSGDGFKAFELTSLLPKIGRASCRERVECSAVVVA